MACEFHWGSQKLLFKIEEKSNLSQTPTSNLSKELNFYYCYKIIDSGRWTAGLSDNFPLKFQYNHRVSKLSEQTNAVFFGFLFQNNFDFSGFSFEYITRERQLIWEGYYTFIENNETI